MTWINEQINELIKELRGNYKLVVCPECLNILWVPIVQADTEITCHICKTTADEDEYTNLF